jgi:hypothetical protein
VAAGHQHHRTQCRNEQKDIEFFPMDIALAQVVISQDGNGKRCGDQETEVKQRVIINDQQRRCRARRQRTRKPRAAECRGQSRKRQA